MQKRDSKGKFLKVEAKQEKDMKPPFQGSKKGFATATVTQLSNGAIIDIYGNDVKINGVQFKSVMKGNVTRYVEYWWDKGELLGKVVKRNPYKLLCDKPLDEMAYERYVFGDGPVEEPKGACCGGSCKCKAKDNVKEPVKVTPAKPTAKSSKAPQEKPIMLVLAFDYESKEAFDKFFAKDLIAGAEAIIMQVHGKQ